LNQAIQKYSSCPGLTRASIYFARAFSKQMDCRVKPGNDILMAFARNTRRDRQAMSTKEQPLDARQYRNTPPQLDEMA
jgi:hypothetical protein